MKRTLFLLSLSLAFFACTKNNLGDSARSPEKDLVGVWFETRNAVCPDNHVEYSNSCSIQLLSDHSGIYRYGDNGITNLSWQYKGGTLSLTGQGTGNNPIVKYDGTNMSLWWNGSGYIQYFLNVSKILPGRWKCTYNGKPYTVSLDASGTSTWIEDDSDDKFSNKWSLEFQDGLYSPFLKFDGSRIQDPFLISSATENFMVTNVGGSTVTFEKIPVQTYFSEDDLPGLWLHSVDFNSSTGAMTNFGDFAFSITSDHKCVWRYFGSENEPDWAIGGDKLVIPGDPSLTLRSLDGLHLSLREESSDGVYFDYFTNITRLLSQSGWALSWPDQDAWFAATFNEDGTSVWIPNGTGASQNYTWSVGFVADNSRPAIKIRPVSNTYSNNLYILEFTDDVLFMKDEGSHPVVLLKQ